MFLQREAHLLMVSCGIIFKVLKVDGLKATSTMIPRLNQLAQQSQNPNEKIAAVRIINTYRSVNGAIYDSKKFGLTHVVKTRFPLLLGGTKTHPQITMKKNTISNEAVGKVAFVITSQTRQQLRQLGYDDDAIRTMKPKTALDIVESNIHRSVKDQINSIETSTVNEPEDITKENNSGSDKEHPNTSTTFDMSSVCNFGPPPPSPFFRVIISNIYL